MEQVRAATLIAGFTRAVEAVVGHADFDVIGPDGPDKVLTAVLPPRQGVTRATVSVDLDDLDDPTFGEDCLARDIAALFGRDLDP